MQLPQARQRPRRVDVDRAALIARGLFAVEHATAQGGGDAHHGVKLVPADELTPLASDVLLILGRNDAVGRAVDAILIKKQPHNLVSTGQRRLGEQQGAARGGRVGGGIQGNRELHGTLGKQTCSPFVDLGSLTGTSGLGIAYITDNLLLDLELTAMEKTGNGEIVSQPKVVTSDKETARILKGTEIPYQESTSQGATSVSFKEASLSLEVTPQITPDNHVIMVVKVTKDEPDYLNKLNDVPPIKKNEVNAKVLVKDGETIVIGGVFSNTQSKVVDKVPFLGDVPYLGRLFRRDVLAEKKSELLVFLTPRIMNNQAIAVSR